MCGDADAGILHHELDRRLLTGGRDLTGAKCNTAGMGEFGGVGKQVAEDLVEPCLVGKEFGFEVLIDINQKEKSFAMCLHGELCLQLPEEGPHIDRYVLQF